jgi:hypothetical protein
MPQDVKEKRVFTYKLSYEEIDAVNRRAHGLRNEMHS